MQGVVRNDSSNAKLKNTIKKSAYFLGDASKGDYVSVFKRTHKLNQPLIKPPKPQYGFLYGRKIKFSPDGKYCAMVLDKSVMMYRTIDWTVVELPNSPSVSWYTSQNCVSYNALVWSEDSKYIFFACPSIHCYKVEDESFTKIGSKNLLRFTYVADIDFAKDSLFVASSLRESFGGEKRKFIEYKFDRETEAFSSPIYMPTQPSSSYCGGRGVSCSGDGKYVAFGDDQDCLYIFMRQENGSWKRLSKLPEHYRGKGGLSWDRISNNRLVSLIKNEPYIKVYDFDGERMIIDKLRITDGLIDEKASAVSVIDSKVLVASKKKNGIQIYSLTKNEYNEHIFKIVNKYEDGLGIVTACDYSPINNLTVALQNSKITCQVWACNNIAEVTNSAEVISNNELEYFGYLKKDAKANTLSEVECIVY